MTPISLEGDSPFSVPNLQHVEATAQGESVMLTLRVSGPGRAELVPIYAHLTFPAADRLLVELGQAVADAAAARRGAGK